MSCLANTSPTISSFTIHYSTIIIQNTSQHCYPTGYDHHALKFQDHTDISVFLPSPNIFLILIFVIPTATFWHTGLRVFSYVKLWVNMLPPHIMNKHYSRACTVEHTFLNTTSWVSHILTASMNSRDNSKSCRVGWGLIFRFVCFWKIKTQLIRTAVLFLQVHLDQSPLMTTLEHPRVQGY